MNTNPKTVGLHAGTCQASTKEICRSLANAGISAIVIEKENRSTEPDDAASHWSGKPGEDLFFNGWKLLF